MDEHLPHRRNPRHRALATAALVPLAALMVAGCGDDGTTPPATTNDSSTSATTESTAPTPPTSAPPADTPLPGASATPGRSYSVRPTAGAVLAVVGVAHDDVLNVRRGPGTSFPVVATLNPLADDVTATGRGWRVPGNGSKRVWFEVSHSGITGWANGYYLAGKDDTTDVTSQVIATLGRRPATETMRDLGREVARSRVHGPEKALIVMSVAPSVGDLGEVTYDVVGLSDDAVRAERLHVFGQPIESGEGFSLKSVEATSFSPPATP